MRGWKGERERSSTGRAPRKQRYAEKEIQLSKETNKSQIQFLDESRITLPGQVRERPRVPRRKAFDEENY